MNASERTADSQSTTGAPMAPSKRRRPASPPEELTIRERIRRAGAEEAQERHRRQVVAMARLIRRAAILHEERSGARDQG
jgi:hypothetical protein